MLFCILVYHSRQLRRSARLPDHSIPLKTDKESDFNSILKGGWETPSQTAPQGALLRKQLFQKSCMDCRHEKSPHFVSRQAVKISVSLSYGQIRSMGLLSSCQGLIHGCGAAGTVFLRLRFAASKIVSSSWGCDHHSKMVSD